MIATPTVEMPNSLGGHLLINIPNETRTQKDNSRLTRYKTKQNICNRIGKINTPTPKTEGAGVLVVVPPLRLELRLSAPEADALSTELRGHLC